MTTTANFNFPDSNTPTVGPQSQRSVEPPDFSQCAEIASRQYQYERILKAVPAGKFVVAQGNQASFYSVAKRAMDLAGATVLLVAFSPVILVTLAILLVTTKGKPFFAQERVGKSGKRFLMLKFRTMRLDAEQMQFKIANEQEGPVFKARRDPRITAVGRFLRKSSIDEMPQLLNVLVGQMSLVGPRPPIAKEVADYQIWQRSRLSVKPGLTCLWQVSGRNEVAFDDWVRMDLWYVKNQSLWTDIKLLLMTPYSVLTCRGAY